MPFIRKKVSLSREGCRKTQFRASHAAWESHVCVLPMQRGKLKITFDDTSATRMPKKTLLTTPPLSECECCVVLRFQTSAGHNFLAFNFGVAFPHCMGITFCVLLSGVQFPALFVQPLCFTKWHSRACKCANCPRGMCKLMAAGLR